MYRICPRDDWRERDDSDESLYESLRASKREAANAVGDSVPSWAEYTVRKYLENEADREAPMSDWFEARVGWTAETPFQVEVVSSKASGKTYILRSVVDPTFKQHVLPILMMHGRGEDAQSGFPWVVLAKGTDARVRPRQQQVRVKLPPPRKDILRPILRAGAVEGHADKDEICIGPIDAESPTDCPKSVNEYASDYLAVFEESLVSDLVDKGAYPWQT